MTQQETGYDTVIVGGRVIDPANGVDQIADVAVRDGRIAAVAPGLAETATATTRIDATGQTEPFGVLVYRNDTGASFFVDLFPASTTPDAYAHFGVPESRGTIQLYVGGTSASRLLGDTIAYSMSFDPAVMQVAVDALESLDTVDVTEWSATADELAAEVSSTPALAKLTVGGVEVSTHLSHGALAVCVAHTVVTRCHEATGSSDSNDPEHQPFDVSFDVDGRFVHVTSDQGTSVSELSVSSDRGRAVIGSTTHDDTFIVAAVASNDATTMTLAFTADGETGTSTATRPSL